MESILLSLIMVEVKSKNELGILETFYDQFGGKVEISNTISRDHPDMALNSGIICTQYYFTPSTMCTCGRNSVATGNDGKPVLIKPKSNGKGCTCDVAGTLMINTTLLSEIHKYNNQAILITLKDFTNDIATFIVDVSTSYRTDDPDKGYNKDIIVKTTKDSGLSFGVPVGERFSLIVIDNVYKDDNFDGDMYMCPGVYFSDSISATFIKDDPKAKDKAMLELLNSNGDSIRIVRKGSWKKACSGLYSTQETVNCAPEVTDGAIVL